MGGVQSSRGGRQQQRDAFTNDLRESVVKVRLNDVYDDDDDDELATTKPCFGFCPIPSSSSGSAASTLVRKFSSAASLLSSTPPPPPPTDYDDGFGTPIPDSIEQIRKSRDAALAYADDDDGTTLGERFTSSSRYGGLEKEVSSGGAYSSRTTTPSNTPPSIPVGARAPRNGSNPQSGAANIVDGPNAESSLYQKYEICEILGVGSTSICHRCVELSSNASRACKIVDKLEIDHLGGGGDAGSGGDAGGGGGGSFRKNTMMAQFLTEIDTLRSLRHPNIIELYDVYISPDKIYIIMELMEGGELFDYVVQKGTLTEEEASRILRKVTSALVYMHSKNVIHRDMKPENLLLAHKPRSSHDIEVKIIDFGLSKILTDTPIASSFLGTRGYLAPEMIQRYDYTKSVDAWALGVIIFVLLCGCLPFDDDCQAIPNSPDLRSKFTLRFPRWAKDLSPSAKDLLNHLLHIDPRKRYSAEQAMNHPWVRGTTASKDSLLQSPGRLKPSPGGKHGKSSQATKDAVSALVANRAIANAQLANSYRSPVRHVRKSSI